MLKYDDATFWITMTLIALSPAVKKNMGSKLSAFDSDLYEFIKQQADRPILWVMRDKDKKEAAKELAQHTLSKIAGASGRDAPNDVRLYLIDGFCGLATVLIGKGGFDIIKKEVEPIAKLVKHQNSMDEEYVALAIQACGLAARKALLEAGLYKGRLT